MLRSLALATLLAGAALAGCQEHQATRSQEATQKPEATPGAAPDDVAVVSTGREPRRALRYHLAKGTTTPLELAVDFDLLPGAAAALTGTGQPTMVFTGTLAVDEVLATGDMKVRITLEHATARARGGGTLGSGAGAVEAPAKRFEGFVETATLSPTGHLRDAHAALPGASAATQAELAGMAQNFEQIAVALPIQPVGLGATWKATKPVTANGIALTVTTTTELTALAGDRASYTASTAVAGADQHTQLGGLDVDVRHIVGSGGGSGSVDLATLAVTGAFTTALHVDMTAGDQSAQLGLTMTVAINQPTL